MFLRGVFSVLFVSDKTALAKMGVNQTELKDKSNDRKSTNTYYYLDEYHNPGSPEVGPG